MKQSNNDAMEKIVSLCKRRGFIFAGSEIYGGLANSWDFGPYGVEMKHNLKAKWWDVFVRRRDDMVGLDAAIIMNPKVWEASGHLENFSDPLVECKACHNRFRADQIEGNTCPNCGGELTSAKQFNLMFQTFIGPAQADADVAYLRPENAQGMFVNFKNVLNTTRRRLPFGIAQIGRNFRNEITPGNFIFRTREFEIAELEYFIKPQTWEAEFEMWLAEIKKWWQDVMQINMDNLVWHEIPDGERAHYSKRTVDIEYKYPFGVKELHGIAYRTDFDLRRHQDVSGEDLRYADPETGEKFLPHVIEPTFGVDRMLLVALLEAYREEETGEDTRIVMKFPAWLAPVKIAVFPLLKNKPPLVEKAKEIFHDLQTTFVCEFDDNGNVGKRYRRQDEIGTPFCITVDFQSLDNGTVTVRERDSMEQERVDVAKLHDYFTKKLDSNNKIIKR